jgi:hypothetical protein
MKPFRVDVHFGDETEKKRKIEILCTTRNPFRKRAINLCTLCTESPWPGVKSLNSFIASTNKGKRRERQGGDEIYGHLICTRMGAEKAETLHAAQQILWLNALDVIA